MGKLKKSVSGRPQRSRITRTGATETRLDQLERTRPDQFERTRSVTLMRWARRLLEVYWLELAGEADAFAAAEAATAAAGVRVVAPGVASASSIGSTVDALAYTRRVCTAIGRTDADVDAAVAALEAAPLSRTGTVAVRARNVRNSTAISTTAAERALGRALVDRGFDVDLEAPDHVLRALFAAGPRVEHDSVDGADGGQTSLCTLGWVTHEPSRTFAPDPTDRPFFQPGSMAPADARAYVNLAGAASGRTVLDPMCGTGGLPIEAGLAGADTVACDAQQKMVTGTRENLRACLDASDRPTAAQRAGSTPTWHVLRGDATALPVDDDVVDGVVFDAPYGRQSKIARHELADLVAGALDESARVASRAVVIADRDWRGLARGAGWVVEASFDRRVHRSLTRRVLVLTRA